MKILKCISSSNNAKNDVINLIDTQTKIFNFNDEIIVDLLCQDPFLVEEFWYKLIVDLRENAYFKRKSNINFSKVVLRAFVTNLGQKNETIFSINDLNII